MEPTSEQELKQLLEEGKITEEEYHELKHAMTEINKGQSTSQDGTKNISNPPHKLGKFALILTLGGVVLPVMGYFVVDTFLCPPNAGTAIGPWFFLFWGMDFAAFVIGIISWKDSLGKAAAITAGILLVLSIIFVA
ncbi:MAG: SHOCT domain-containing protein [Phycisphaerae bacterium]|nr:SHOCT domain-containing protein [Phycisphaerae bacterium]